MTKSSSPQKDFESCRQSSNLEQVEGLVWRHRSCTWLKEAFPSLYCCADPPAGWLRSPWQGESAGVALAGLEMDFKCGQDLERRRGKRAAFEALRTFVKVEFTACSEEGGSRADHGG